MSVCVCHLNRLLDPIAAIVPRDRYGLRVAGSSAEVVVTLDVEGLTKLFL